MYKFKTKLLNNGEKLFGTKVKLVKLNFKITLPLDMDGSRLLDIQVDTQLVIFLFLSIIRELSIGANTRKFS